MTPNELHKLVEPLWEEMPGLQPAHLNWVGGKCLFWMVETDDGQWGCKADVAAATIEAACFRWLLERSISIDKDEDTGNYFTEVYDGEMVIDPGLTACLIRTCLVVAKEKGT